jgi:hypothetical protein
MAHRDRCRIQDPDLCFGCKTDGIGFDGGHLTKTTRDEAGNDTREWRSGRVDVRINAPAVSVLASTREIRQDKEGGT